MSYKLPSNAIYWVQKILNRDYKYNLAADNIYGPKTRHAIGYYLTHRLSPYDAIWKGGEKRRIVAAMQLLCEEANINAGKIDGYYGPQTEHAFSLLVAKAENWPENKRENRKRKDWPTYNGAGRYYGKPGKNLVRLELPFEMRLAWNRRQKITNFAIHRKCHDSALRALKSILGHYGEDEVQRLGFDIFGGCFNNRPMRGSNKLSTHAYGAAIDFDPARNRLRWGAERASLAHPDCEVFWQCWEAEGWVSLGRRKNFDWMHVQAVRL